QTTAGSTGLTGACRLLARSQRRRTNMDTLTGTTRRRLLASAAGLGASAALAACSGGGGAAAKPAATQPVTITWWSNLGDQHPESLTRVKIIEEFNATNAPLKVSPEKFGASLTNIEAAIAADTPPDTYFIA